MYENSLPSRADCEISIMTAHIILTSDEWEILLPTARSRFFCVVYLVLLATIADCVIFWSLTT